jgi:uridine kinase
MDMKTNHGKGVLVVGIAGGTGSGKTTIANALLKQIKQRTDTKPITAEMMAMDSYYRELHHLTLEEREKTNFDHPDALEIDLLVKHIKDLKSGKNVEVPVYSFETHQRLPQTTTVLSSDVLILEGILLFVEPALRDLIDIKVFVDADADIRFIRRLKRDVAERGRTVDQICKQYLETVRVMHDQFVEPSKVHADLIVPNIVGGDWDVIVDLLAARAALCGASNTNATGSPSKKLKS